MDQRILRMVDVTDMGNAGAADGQGEKQFLKIGVIHRFHLPASRSTIGVFQTAVDAV